MAIGRFLAGIFGLIWSPKLEKYLILQRSEHRDHAPGVWECVTGRVDQGEGFAQALQREAQEEIGVEVQFEFIVGTVHFYRGPRTAEYEMVGLVCFCTLDDPERVHISDEHAHYSWVSAQEASQMFAEDERHMSFIHDAIQRAEAIRRFSSPELMAYLRQSGMELEID